MRILFSTLAILFSICVAHANEIPTIENFTSESLEIRSASYNFRDEDKKEVGYFIHPTTNDESATFDVMFVFKNDYCFGKLRHARGLGSVPLKCKSGATINTNFKCSSVEGCFMRGNHNKRGKIHLKVENRTDLQVYDVTSFYEGADTALPQGDKDNKEFERSSELAALNLNDFVGLQCDGNNRPTFIILDNKKTSFAVVEFDTDEPTLSEWGSAKWKLNEIELGNNAVIDRRTLKLNSLSGQVDCELKDLVGLISAVEAFFYNEMQSNKI